MGECVTFALEDISFTTYIQHNGGIEADGIAQLCRSTKCHRTGGTGAVKANTQDWYQRDGLNPRVRPWIKCGLKPAENKAGPGRANAIEERSAGSHDVQNSYTTHTCMGPSTMRHSTPTASAIPDQDTQDSQRPEHSSQQLSSLSTGTIPTKSAELIPKCIS